MSDLIRILVFGTTGVGKTTVCNVLASEDEPANDGVKGVTFESRTTQIFQIDNREAILTDTIGLNESSQGTVPSKDSMLSLLKLLRDSKEGYNLFIHVLKKGRITQTDENNYKLFIESITKNKIPKIAVVTNCETYDPMSNWLYNKDDNGIDNKTYIENAGLYYDDIVCVGFPEAERKDLNDIFLKLWPLSQQSICTSILKHSASQPIILFDNSNQFILLLQRVWNSFIELIDLPNKNKFIWHVNKELVKIMKELGIKDEEIIELLKPMNMLNADLDLIRSLLFDTKNSEE
ncbi:MAG: GTPase domain-containing protein [Scytonema hyalinum WJT4-NPBG1]|jgi:GTPase SAR1 family protein|nr:GTPase domain-containing protein [Scytonema hyalinum WJT4-NPBG1]